MFGIQLRKICVSLKCSVFCKYYLFIAVFFFCFFFNSNGIMPDLCTSLMFQMRNVLFGGFHKVWIFQLGMMTEQLIIATPKRSKFYILACTTSSPASLCTVGPVPGVCLCWVIFPQPYF